MNFICISRKLLLINVFGQRSIDEVLENYEISNQTTVVILVDFRAKKSEDESDDKDDRLNYLYLPSYPRPDIRGFDEGISVFLIQPADRKWLLNDADLR